MNLKIACAADTAFCGDDIWILLVEQERCACTICLYVMQGVASVIITHFLLSGLNQGEQMLTWLSQVEPADIST